MYRIFVSAGVSGYFRRYFRIHISCSYGNGGIIKLSFKNRYIKLYALQLSNANTENKSRLINTAQNKNSRINSLIQRQGFIEPIVKNFNINEILKL